MTAKGLKATGRGALVCLLALGWMTAMNGLKAAQASDASAELIYNPLLAEAVATQFLPSTVKVTHDKKFLIDSRHPTLDLRVLQRYYPDGRLDESFQEFARSVFSLRNVPLADGSALVWWPSDRNGPMVLLKLRADGTEDTSFQRRDLLSVTDVKEAPSGKFYVLHWNAVTRQVLTRLNADGTTDPNFTSPRDFTHIDDVAVAPTGEVYVRGRIPGPSREQQADRMARLRDGGSVDPTFAAPLFVRAIWAYADGVFIERADVESVGRAHEFIKLRHDGSVDPEFRAMPTARFEAWQMPLRDDDGRFYSIIQLGTNGLFLNRYLPNGELDGSFVPGTFDGINARAQFVAVIGSNIYARNTVLVNGAFPAQHGLVRFPLAQEHPRVLFTPPFQFPHTLTFDHVYERQGATNMIIARTGPNDQPLLVRYQSRSGAAREGFDYRSLRGELLFEPGVTRKTLTVTVIDDTQLELLEDFFIDFFAEDGRLLNTLSAAIPNDDRGIAIHAATLLPDGTLRIPVLLSWGNTVRASADLVTWTDYPVSAEHLEIPPGSPHLFFATPAAQAP